MDINRQELLLLIEEVRTEMNKRQNSNNLQDPCLLHISYRLDELLNKYEHLKKQKLG